MDGGGGVEGREGLKVRGQCNYTKCVPIPKRVECEKVDDSLYISRMCKQQSPVRICGQKGG